MYDITDMNRQVYTVRASSLKIESDAYVLWDGNRIVASFPLRNTASVVKR